MVITGAKVQGGYNIYVKKSAEGSWKLAESIEDKSITEFPITGLDAQSNYDFRLASVTNEHENNFNTVISDSSSSVTSITSGGSCTQPSIDFHWRDEILLTINGSFDTYQWSTGETTPTIMVPPLSPPQWYWVKVTFATACEESAVVLVKPGDDVFLDGFGTGDTTAWSDGTH